MKMQGLKVTLFLYFIPSIVPYKFIIYHSFFCDSLCLPSLLSPFFLLCPLYSSNQKLPFLKPKTSCGGGSGKGRHDIKVLLMWRWWRRGGDQRGGFIDRVWWRGCQRDQSDGFLDWRGGMVVGEIGGGFFFFFFFVVLAVGFSWWLSVWVSSKIVSVGFISPKSVVEPWWISFLSLRSFLQTHFLQIQNSCT